MRILVVEDESALAGFVAGSLQAEGYSPVVVGTGTDALWEVREGVDLMLLDLTLPDMDGLDVLRQVRRAQPSLPVIVVSARGLVTDKVAGLDLGADDYLTKPFSLEELAARVRSQLRGTTQPRADALDVDWLVIDLRTRRVRRDDVEVDLTAREYELLVYLARHPDQVLTRQQILQRVWGLDHDPGTKVLDVYVGYLRRKLEVTGREDPIETVRHVGYRLRREQA